MFLEGKRIKERKGVKGGKGGYQIITRNSKYDSISTPILELKEEGAEEAEDIDNC